jgi:translocation and assembly module TamB
VPGGSAPKLDPTIVVVRSPDDAMRLDATVPGTLGDAVAAVPGTVPEPPKAQPTALDRMRMTLEVSLGSRVYIRRTDADIPLQGALYVTKAPEDAIRISGQVFATRGWYTFQGRRLEIEHVYVYFSGETPIDPYLDVRAIYRSPDYRIAIAVQGTVQQPTLDLSSQPPLDQSDILSVILFGKPASQLTSGQGQGLQQQAIGILASYVAPELERSVVDTFGLTSLTFQMPTGNTAGTVGVGRYFGDDIFVSIAQDFGGPQGGTPRQLQGLVGSSVTIQYYLTPTFTLQGSASSQGESAVDVIWQKRY